MDSIARCFLADVPTLDICEARQCVADIDATDICR